MFIIFKKFGGLLFAAILVFGVIGVFIVESTYAAPITAMIDWMLPLPEGNYRITQGDKDDPNTCQKGWSHCSDKKVLKCAIDLAAMKPGEIEGYPLLAPYSGKIGRRGWDPYGGGYYLYIEHDDGLISHYEHLREQRLVSGFAVQKGDCIGRVSNTGGDYAPHLHFVVLEGTGQSCVKIAGIYGNSNFNYSPPPNPTIVRSTNRKMDEITNCPGESTTPPIPPSTPPLPPPSTPNNPPNRPSNISPYNAQKLQSRTPELCAKENGDPDPGDYVTGYLFQIHDRAQNWDSGWTNSSCVTTTPLGNFVYKWHVRVRDAQGRESDWSEDWNFPVEASTSGGQLPQNNPPLAPSLISPQDWQEFQDITPQLCAQNNGDPDPGDYISSYRFEIYESAQNWDSGWINFNCITPSSLSGNTYKWHARVRDSHNAESAWSSDGHFTIKQNKPPYPPTLISPENGWGSQMTPVYICAQENGDPDEGDRVAGYRFEIFEGAQTWDSDWVLSSCAKPPILSESGYKWRAKVKDLNGAESEWSKAWSFTITANQPPESSATTGQIAYVEETSESPVSDILKIRNSDGSGEKTLITAWTDYLTWSPNGQEIVYVERPMTEKDQWLIMSINAQTGVTRILVNPEQVIGSRYFYMYYDLRS
jgi:hypothetical protein